MDINLKEKFIEQLHRLENMEDNFLVTSSWNKLEKRIISSFKETKGF